MLRPFMQRLERAARFIENDQTDGRELDEAFENDDGEAMSAALWTIAEQRPRLKYQIEQHGISRPREHLIGLPLPTLDKLASSLRKTKGRDDYFAMPLFAMAKASAGR